jgi:hypothetical protein
MPLPLIQEFRNLFSKQGPTNLGQAFLAAEGVRNTLRLPKDCQGNFTIIEENLMEMMHLFSLQFPKDFKKD